MPRNPVDSPVKDDYKAICFAWEKLRLIYNGVLVVTSLTMIFGFGIYQFAHSIFYLISLPLLAFAANLCFFAGPAAECYLYFLGLRQTYIRWLFFVPGTIFAVLLTVLLLFIKALSYGMEAF